MLGMSPIPSLKSSCGQSFTSLLCILKIVVQLAQERSAMCPWSGLSARRPVYSKLDC